MDRRTFLASPLLLALNAKAAGTLYAFGDSITVGLSATPGYSYVSRIAQAKGWVVDNRAYNGHQVPDTAARVYGLPVQSDTVSVWLAGFNDYRFFGASPVGFETYRNGVMALAAWLAIPETAKVRARTLSGDWGNTAAYGLGRYHSTKGASLTFHVTGTVVYVAGIAMVNGGGVFGVTVDGSPAGIGYCSGGALSLSGVGYSPFLVRIPGLRPGQHEVVVTVQSQVGNVFVDWVAGNIAGPTLYLGGPLRMADYASAFVTSQNPAMTKGSDAIVRKYSEATREIARQLSSDGLDVVFVDPNSRYRPELGDETQPDVHPNDQGHARIAEAFLERM